MAAEHTLSEQHAALGASMGTYFDCLLPARYGDVAAECRVARQSVALFDTNYHAVASFTGPDRVRYLNAVLTCNVQDLKDGEGTTGLLLNPQGHILAEVRCLAAADQLLAIFHRSVGRRTAKTLEKFIIMDDVTQTDVTPGAGSLAVEGPAAGAMLKDLYGLDLDAMREHAHAEVSVNGIACRAVRFSHFGEAGAELFVADGARKLPFEAQGKPAALGALWDTLLEAARARGGAPIGYQALNALRLEAGVPWIGYDFDDKMIPHEAALETSHISYTKGCYTGQEIVERVRSRGHANRRRVRLEFRGAGVPTGGEKLLAGGKEIGGVTSVALAPHLGRVIGMGYVRTEFSESGSALQWSGGKAEVL